METHDLTVREAADRMLVVIYHLTGGDMQKTITKAEIIAECNRLRIFDMSKDEFREYLAGVERARGHLRN